MKRIELGNMASLKLSQGDIGQLSMTLIVLINKINELIDAHNGQVEGSVVNKIIHGGDKGVHVHEPDGMACLVAHADHKQCSHCKLCGEYY